MSLKLEGSGSTEISQVYPFNLPDTQNSIENAFYEFYDPSVNIADTPSQAQRNIRWEISGSNHMTDLKNSYILMRVKLTRNAAGTDLYAKGGAGAQVAAASRLSLCAGWSQLMVDRLNLYLNGVNLSEGDHYAYKGWVASILEEEEGWATEPCHTISNAGAFNTSFNGASVFKVGSGEHEGWVLDHPKGTENVNFDTNPSRRFTQENYVSEGEGFTIIIRPRETMFLQSEFLVPQVKLRLELLTSVPNFWTQGETGATTAPYLSILNSRLFLKRIQLTPNSERTLLTTLAQTPAKYLFPRMRYTNQVLGQVQSRQVVSLLPGPRPNRVIVFFSKTASADPAVGSLDNSPVAFTEFHNTTNFVRRIYINVAGRQYPQKELEALGKNDVHRAYEMYKLSCADHRKPLLSLRQFADNYTIYCFNTNKSLMNDDEGVLHSGAMTDIQVNIMFNAVPNVDVTMHVIAVDDGVCEIDASGTVSKNY